MPSIRELPADFTTWVNANFLTGVPNNISAAKMRELALRIRANGETSPAVYLGSGVPSVQAGIGTTFVPLEYNAFKLNSATGELLTDDTLSNQIVLADAGNYVANFGVLISATATLEAPANTIMSLTFLQLGSPSIVINQVTNGAGKPITLTFPPILTNASQGDTFELGIASDNGAGVSATILEANFAMAPVPWWTPGIFTP